MEKYLDAELVALAQQGEAGAFNELVDRYQGKVTSLVYRYVNNTDTALDLVQDIFFKIFRNLENFKGDSKFSSWLFRIAVNDCIDHGRRRKVRKEYSLDAFQETGYDVADNREDVDVEAVYANKVEHLRVREALEGLKPRLKTVVVMKIYQEMSFEEIAEVLNEPVSTVKSRLYKALNVLGGQLRRGQFLKEVIP